MKQRITVEQLKELTDEQRERLRDWWKPDIGDKYVIFHKRSHRCCFVTGYGITGILKDRVQEHRLKLEYAGVWYYKGTWHAKRLCFPLLNIGQCIEILLDLDGLKYVYDRYGLLNNKYVYLGWEEWDEGTELIDALWEAVKEIL